MADHLSWAPFPSRYCFHCETMTPQRQGCYDTSTGISLWFECLTGDHPSMEYRSYGWGDLDDLGPSETRWYPVNRNRYVWMTPLQQEIQQRNTDYWLALEGHDPAPVAPQPTAAFFVRDDIPF